MATDTKKVTRVQYGLKDRATGEIFQKSLSFAWYSFKTANTKYVLHEIYERNRYSDGTHSPWKLSERK